MELDDNEEHDDSLVEFIRTNPSSAISARYVKLLRTEEKEECIMTMIENAAYQETWMSYFDYTENKGIVVSDEIAFEAVNDVGLDPCSAPLWLRVIHLCSDDTKKRELFHLALRLPLYQQYEIYKAYKSFEADVAKSDEQTSNSCLAFSEVIPYTDILKNEPIWPDRFVNVATCDELQRSNLCLQWNLLLPVLLDNCEKRDEFHDVNIRRAELALRQLCSQFAFEDVSWYVYATFVAVVMDDKKQASDILRRGKVTIANASIGLCICDAVLNQLDHVGDKVEKQTVNYQLFLQRLYANTANDSLQSRKRFRDIGKAATAGGSCDWRIFHQWAFAERCVLKDLPMASKVYERGISCVSKSFKDVALLTNEAVKFHLWRQDEREIIGYAERQIELLSSSNHFGLKRASWNHLINNEILLGLPSLPKTFARRAEKCQDLPSNTLIERYRVGMYLPCSDDDIDWAEFVEDLTKARREEQESIFEALTPLAHSTICNPSTDKFTGPVPDTTLWSPFAGRHKNEPIPVMENADEIVGPRFLRGKLVYKVVIDDKTASRLKREERARNQREVNEMKDTTTEVTRSALQNLAHKISAREWNPSQIRLCRLLSTDWLFNILTVEDLDLAKKP